jgi:cytoskeletal protein CcmA (bactofilin family)
VSVFRSSPNNRDQESVAEPERAAASYPSFADRDLPNRPAAMDAERCANVIAAGSKWSGSLNIEDSVRIEGQLSGEVIAKGTVHIAEGARVDAKIRAAFVIVRGTFKGEVRCSERLELLPKSSVEGQIVTKVLNVHEGAIVDGSIQMTSDSQASAAQPARARETRNGNTPQPEPEAITPGN